MPHAYDLRRKLKPLSQLLLWVREAFLTCGGVRFSRVSWLAYAALSFSSPQCCSLLKIREESDPFSMDLGVLQRGHVVKVLEVKMAVRSSEHGDHPCLVVSLPVRDTNCQLCQLQALSCYQTVHKSFPAQCIIVLRMAPVDLEPVGARSLLRSGGRVDPDGEQARGDPRAS